VRGGFRTPQKKSKKSEKLMVSTFPEGTKLERERTSLKSVQREQWDPESRRGAGGGGPAILGKRGKSKASEAGEKDALEKQLREKRGISTRRKG